jgi:uncharacterized protein (DUF362 family)
MIRPIVAFGRAFKADYPSTPPFHPSERYPECPFADVGSEPNAAYAAVRDTLRHLGLDAAGFGTAAWNPLGAVVKPGDHVVIKPNFIFHKNLRGTDYRCVVTHSSIVRAVVDYVLIALRGSGRISVLEAPNPNTDFERVVRTMQVDQLLRFYEDKQAPVVVRDLRTEQYHFGLHAILSETRLNGDPNGKVRVDLGERSEFAKLPGGWDLLHGTSHDRREAAESKSPTHNVYEIHRSYLQADVIISLAKLKTHKKTGVTLALKNFIGLSARKNLMPHYRILSPVDGGDEYPDHDFNPMVRRLKRLDWWMRDRLLQDLKWPRTYIVAAAAPTYLRRAIAGRSARNGHRLSEIERGDWYGNDTLWRTILDLNKVLLFADQDGVLHDRPQRRYIAIVDGVVTGEGEGPLSPQAREDGVVVSSLDPVAIDVAIARWMGFDEAKIPTLAQALQIADFPITALRTRADVDAIEIASALYNGPLADCPSVNRSFRPSAGWVGHIEKAGAVPVSIPPPSVSASPLPQEQL